MFPPSVFIFRAFIYFFYRTYIVRISGFSLQIYFLSVGKGGRGSEGFWRGIRAGEEVGGTKADPVSRRKASNIKNKTTSTATTTTMTIREKLILMRSIYTKKDISILNRLNTFID